MLTSIFALVFTLTIQDVAERKDRLTRYIDANIPTDWENATHANYWRRQLRHMSNLAFTI